MSGFTSSRQACYKLSCPKNNHTHVFTHDSCECCRVCGVTLCDAMDRAEKNRSETENRRSAEGALRERLAKRAAEKETKAVARR